MSEETKIKYNQRHKAFYHRNKEKLAIKAKERYKEKNLFRGFGLFTNDSSKYEDV